MSMGRWFGHSFAALFGVMGVIFLYMGMSDGISDWFDANSTCNYGDCASGSARMGFLITGATFVGVAVITSFATEFAMRQTQRAFSIFGTMSSAGTAGSEASIADILEPFGIDLDAARAAGANVNVQHGVIDLRGQRRGEVPTDPAGLNQYLQGFGINLGEQALRNATVVDSRTEEAPFPASNGMTAPVTPVTMDTPGEGERERALIVRKKDRGATSGNQRLVEFELEVQPAGRVPYRVEVASLVRESLAGLLIEGSSLNVRVDPLNRNSVTIDWSEN